MKIIFLPNVVSVLVFDIDLTLYDDHDYVAMQVRLLIERLAEELGRPLQQIQQEVTELRSSYAETHGGRKPSLGNTFLQCGIDIQTSVRWREELFEPEVYLHEDRLLAEVLNRLSKHFIISAVTNNPTSTGERTLRALGVDSFFSHTIGLDLSGVSKPSMIPFEIVAEKTGMVVAEMVSIGDRMEIDIELPVKHGMGGILVEGVDDVYTLPDFLIPAEAPPDGRTLE